MNIVFKKLLAVPFFHRERTSERSGEIIRWWESRRVVFNLMNLVVGGSLLLVLYILDSMIKARFGEPLTIRNLPLEILFWIIVGYAVLLNVFYTGAYLFELIVRYVSNINSRIAEYIFLFCVSSLLLLTTSITSLYIYGSCRILMGYSTYDPYGLQREDCEGSYEQCAKARGEVVLK